MLAGALLGSMAASASASAAALFVSKSGNDGSACTSAAQPCLTIAAAVTKAEATPGVATINVGPGIFTEDVNLTHASDAGAAIVGAGSGLDGTTIQGVAGGATVALGSASSGNSLSHLHVVRAVSDLNDGVDVSSSATLSDVAIEMQTTDAGVGLNAPGLSHVTFSGGSVTMADSTSGAAVAGNDGGLAMSGVTVAQSGSGPGVDAKGQIALSNVTITMSNASSSAQALRAAPTPGATLDHVSLSGAWQGNGLLVGGTATVRDSSFVSGAANTGVIGAFTDGGSAGHSVLVQRSVFREANSSSGTPTLLATDTDVTIDSSELLGGLYALQVGHSTAGRRTATVISSTLDAGSPGSRDASPAASILASAGSTSSSVVDVALEGSIALEASIAQVSNGATATINCSNSDVPGQSQGADATHGAINCANASAGNVTTNPVAALLIDPTASPPNYNLQPASSAVDSVPESAINPPPGVSASATDLAGNARVADGNSDCVARRDRGALELTGHAGTVPVPTISGPSNAIAGMPVNLTGAASNEPPETALSFAWTFSDAASAGGPTAAHAFAAPGAASATLTASAGGSCKASTVKAINVTSAPPAGAGKISTLRVWPPNMLAARSGPTLLASVRGIYGALVTYQDSQAETAAFTVQSQTSGRRAGSSCVKLTRRNRGRPRCSLYTNLGNFAVVDVAGSNRLVFSGRIRGHRLPTGHYRLRAVPIGAGRPGAPAYELFNVRN